MDTQQLFKTLAVPLRLNILLLLKLRGTLCVYELTQAFELAQPQISRELAKLKMAGFIHSTRHGKHMHYCLRDDLAPWVNTIIDAALSEQKPKLPALECTHSSLKQ